MRARRRVHGRFCEGKSWTAALRSEGRQPGRLARWARLQTVCKIIRTKAAFRLHCKESTVHDTQLNIHPHTRLTPDYPCSDRPQ